MAPTKPTHESAGPTTQRSKRFRFKYPHHTPKPLTKPASTKQPSPPPGAAGGLDEGADGATEGITDADTEEPTFSTSLFSALSSSSAAQYWADIYGQPIHIYPRPVISGRPFTDEEYVAYVQRRLWEGTREGMEERARERKVEREMEQERVEGEEREREVRRKEAEKARKRREKEEEDLFWQRVIREYIAAWGGGSEIPWPQVGGGVLDAESLGEFLRREAGVVGVGFEQVVKAERVRWHPDKILQRFGEGDGNEKRMKRVNEVWRAIDEIWRGVKE